MRNQISILIVDDSDDLRDMLQVLLVAEGYAIQVASDAKTMLSLLVSGSVFDFIVLDLSLQDMGGEELIQKVLQSIDQSQTKLILFSARADLKTLADRYKTGYIGKPFKFDYVLSTIKSLSDI